MKHHGIMDDNNLNETFLKMMIKMKCAPKSILTENADVVKDFMGIYGPAVAVRGLSSYEDPAVSMLFRHLFDDSNTQGIKLMKIDTAEFLLRNIFYNMNWINSLAHGWKISNVTGIIDGKGKRNTEDRKYLCSIIRETILDSATITLNAVVKKYYENIDKPTSTNTGQRTINATFKKVLEEIFNDEFFEDTRAKKAKMANRLKK
jgi:hypothetical protein